jgi:lipopolysaccharide transport protein LptA
MPQRISRLRLALGLGLLVAAAPCPFAAESSILDTQELSYGFERSEFDFKNDIAQFHGRVRVTQGPNSIQADEAIARAFRSDNKQWEFKDAVTVRTAEAQLTAQSAVAAFERNVLVQARVEGAPAQFERINGPSERLARGRARVIEYDVATDTVTLSGDVWFGYGADEFRGETVVYSLRDERVRVSGGDAGSVQGILRPRLDEKTEEALRQAPDSGRRAPAPDLIREGDA